MKTRKTTRHQFFKGLLGAASMVHVVRLINHFFWFPGDTETELSKNSRGCSAHGNLLPALKRNIQCFLVQE